MGVKLPRILPKVATSTSLSGSFTCRKFTTWNRRLYFPFEGRRAEDFFARKIRRLRPGLNPRTRVPEASTLTSRPPKPLTRYLKLMTCSRSSFDVKASVHELHIEFCSKEFNENLYSLLEHFNADLHRPTYRPTVYKTLTHFLKLLMGTNTGTYKTHIILKSII